MHHGFFTTTLEELEKSIQYNTPLPAVPYFGRHTESKMAKIGATGISYSHDNIIGQGSTSIIYKGSFMNFPAAIKRIQSDLVKVYENELKVWQEAKRTSQHENVNIVKLFTWIPRVEGDGERIFYFAMELAKCDLGKRIKTINRLEGIHCSVEKEIEREKIAEFIHDAAKGLGWLHTSGILHRDIKPENILIFDKAQNSSQSGHGEMAKLGDFGVSRILSGSSTGTNSIGKGTSDWIAPEALISLRDQQEFYSTKAIDIFSLGMTSHFALTLGIHPFGHSGAFTNMNIIDKNICPSKIGAPDYAASHLFQWMMEKEPKNRPGIQQVLNHPYFWDWKESLQFLVDVGRCLYDKIGYNLIRIRMKIDQTYLERMLFLQQNPNWKSKMSRRRLELLMQRKSNGSKHYGGESVMMLVELIRDKHMHPTDVVDELLSEEVFGEGGSLSEEKYIKYFLAIFPDLVIFLFCMLGNETGQCVDILRRRYFREFEKVPLI